MKVLFMTNIPSPYRVEFFNELSKLCELTVLYERVNASDREKSWISQKYGNYEVVFLDGKKIGNDSSISFGAIKHIRKNQYDIIVIGVYHTVTAMITMEYLQRKNIKFILSSDGGFIKKDSKLKFRLKKHFISRASAYLSTGDNTNKYLVHYGANEKNIYKYPFTTLHEKDLIEAPISYSEKQKFRKKLGIVEKRVIFSVGQMIQRKGFDILLKSVAQLDWNCGIYIAGGEPTKEYIEIIRERHLNNVHFVGFKSKNELIMYYKAADIFILPTREDIWGLVINEAMSYGLPVITTDKCNAGLELIENGKNGYVVPANNVESIKNAIDNVFGANIDEKMSVNSIKAIEKYTLENMAKEHVKIFNEIAK